MYLTVSHTLSKILRDNPEKFKSILNNYFFAHSFYSVEEYFNVNRE
jgi:RNA:NAD 2'-phosphotransferase (TPT1/KptA family)